MPRQVNDENNLATLYPDVAKEWHPTKNGDLLPSDVTYGTAKRVWWLCPVGHEYQATVHDRTAKGGTNCPICNLRNESSFPEQAILFYIRKLYPNALSKYKAIFEKSMELDIFIPEIRLGIEFDGAHWHKTETEHNREKIKYSTCQKNCITLFRVKEDNGERWPDVADTVWYINKVRKVDELEEVIRAILTSIDRVSNAWTRTKPVFCSPVSVDVKRDRAEIGKYLSKIENSLADQRPDVLNKWDYEKNGNLSPNMFSVSSNQVVFWKCPDCGHEWQCSINSMTREGRYGCAICANVQRGKTFTKKVVERVGSLAETNPQLAKQWHPQKNDALKAIDVTANYNKKVWWICNTCSYEWQASPNNRNRGIGCPRCSGRVPKVGVNDLATCYPEVALEWNHKMNEGKKPSDFCAHSGKKVWWICSQCGKEWEAVINSRTAGHGCPKCRKKQTPDKS